MIKNFQPVTLPIIELGNLGVHNCSSERLDKDASHYPLVRCGRQLEDGKIMMCIFMKHISEVEYNETICDQFNSPAERLLDYAMELATEHSGFTDEQMSKPSSYIGRKRCARWRDEQYRRGLKK